MQTAMNKVMSTDNRRTAAVAWAGFLFVLAYILYNVILLYGHVPGLEPLRSRAHIAANIIIYSVLLIVATAPLILMRVLATDNPLNRRLHAPITRRGRWLLVLLVVVLTPMVHFVLTPWVRSLF